MVGYWQTMKPQELLNEVNNESRNKALPDLVLGGNWNYGGVNYLDHTFERSFDVSPFKLAHLWIDLRRKRVALRRTRSP